MPNVDELPFIRLENQCCALLEKGYPHAYVAKYCLCSGSRDSVPYGGSCLCRRDTTARGVWGGVMSSHIVRNVTARLRDALFGYPGSCQRQCHWCCHHRSKEVGAWPWISVTALNRYVKSIRRVTPF